MRILSADHVLPISSPPIESGAVLVEGNTIVAVGAAESLVRMHPSAKVSEFGNAAIIPGLINCHSHLEITSMRGALDDVEHDFSAWLLRLTAIRDGLSQEDIVRAATLGAKEGASAGVTCFADIGRFGFAGLAALKNTGLRGVVYQETEFAADDRVARENFSSLMDKYEALAQESTDLVKVGISPHSPYTVGPKLLKLIANESIGHKIPLTIHAAESPAEQQLLEHGTGFFISVFDKYNVEWHSPHCSSVEYLRNTGILAARPLLAHCVTLSNSDIQMITDSGASIAHCPKSNAKFGHGIAPLERFLDCGVQVGLGSDSVASNNTCDLIEEARFAVLTARNRPDKRSFIQADKALHLATLGGAATLGMDNVVGSLETGKRADLAVISLGSSAHQPINSIYSAIIFASNSRDVVMTMVDGKEIYTDLSHCKVDSISDRSS